MVAQVLDPTDDDDALPRAARLRGWAVALGLLLLAAAGAAVLIWRDDVPAAVSVGLGGVLLAALSLLYGAGGVGMGALIRHDPCPALITDTLGAVILANPAARRLAGGKLSVARILRDQMADPGALFRRLQSRAQSDGSAREIVAGASGPVAVGVHRLGRGRFLWRFDGPDEAGLGSRAADSLGLPMLTANSQGIVLFANAALRRLLGHRPRRMADVFGAGVVPVTGLVTAIPAGSNRALVRVTAIAGAGGRQEIYLSPAAQADGGTRALTGFDDLPVPLMRFSPEGRLVAANRAARSLTGDDAGEAPRIQDLFDGLGRPLRDWLADVATGQHPGGAEVLQLLSAEGEAFVQVTLRRIAGDAAQGPSDVLAILQDATTLKRMEAQYVQSQKMQAIGQLAGGIAHDFNNLLTAISGHCDLLLLRRRAGEADHADLTQISQNANRAAALVAQLLAFSRKQTMKPERIDLPEALADLTHLLNRLVGEKIELRLQHDPALGTVRADRRQLEQAIMNLVVNARDAMAEGGLIRIETQDIRIDRDTERGRATVPAGRYAAIRVRDEGTGIPEDRQDKIFEPFFTTKRPGEGTGLGLSMVYGIVKQSGGFVFVDSRPGQGSCFEILLPVQDMADRPAEVPPAPAAPDRPARLSEGVILLVEDEPPVRAFAARALRLRGHSVLEADTAEEALRILQDPALQVDVFVTDVVMPGLDGPSWVSEALKTRPEVRVVFVSGYAEDCLADVQDTLPGSVFLPKPFSLVDLTQTVQRQLEAEAHPQTVPA